MSNIFDDLNKYTNDLFSENKPFWQDSNNGFSKVVGPNGEILEEESIYKEIQLLDLQRLRRSEK